MFWLIKKFVMEIKAIHLGLCRRNWDFNRALLDQQTTAIG